MANLQDIYLPKNYFTQLAGFTAKEFNRIKHLQTTDGFPVFQTMLELKNLLTSTEEMLGNSANNLYDDNAAQEQQEKLRLAEKEILNNKLMEHKIMATAIAIETKMGLLISKEEAEQRICESFRSLRNKLTLFLEKSTQMLLQIATEDVLNYRVIKKVQTDCYNGLIDDLYKESDNISWEEDGKTETLLQRINAFKKADPAFLKLFEDLYGVKDEV